MEGDEDVFIACVDCGTDFDVDCCVDCCVDCFVDCDVGLCIRVESFLCNRLPLVGIEEGSLFDLIGLFDSIGTLSLIVIESLVVVMGSV